MDTVLLKKITLDPVLGGVSSNYKELGTSIIKSVKASI